MNTTKTLMLAAMTALSLGVGTAMAQDLIPSYIHGDYYAAPIQTAPAISAAPANQVQSGSSDVEKARPGSQIVQPFNGDYGDLAGVG